MAEPAKSLEAFTADLQREAQALGIVPQNHLAAAQDPKVAYRASMLPIGNYEDGSIAFPVWPQGLVDAKEAMGRFGRGEAPQSQDAVLAGAVMSGGLGMIRPLGSVGMTGRTPILRGGRQETPPMLSKSTALTVAPKGLTVRVGSKSLPVDSWEQVSNAYRATIGEADVGASQTPAATIHDASGKVVAHVSYNGKVWPGAGADWKPGDKPLFDPLPSHSVEAGRGPVSARVYRGTPREEQWPPGTGHEYNDAFWASDSPAVASGYANAGQPWAREPNVMPADVTFRNPMVVDAGGGDWNMVPGHATSNYAAAAARKAGHDGLVIKNVDEGGGVANTYVALQPGTVKSPYTGETLFSNAPEAAPVGLAPLAAGEDAEFAADLRRQAIALGIIEGPPLEGVPASPVENYLEMAAAEQQAPLVSPLFTPPEALRIDPETWRNLQKQQRDFDEINRPPLPYPWDDRPSPIPGPWRG